MFPWKSKEKKMAAEADAKLQAILARREARRGPSDTPVVVEPSSAAASPPPEREDERKPEGSTFLKGIKRMVSLGKPQHREDTPNRAADHAGIMVQGGGTLACCPLKTDAYQKAFEAAEDLPRVRTSRLYTTFTGVLSDQAPLEAFVQFLTQQRQLDLLRFWLAAEKFRADAPSMKPEDRAERALKVYQQYVCRNGANDIGLEDDVVRAVELSLSPEDGVVSGDCLAAAGEAVLARLQEVYLPLFLQSSIYVAYCLRILAPDTAAVEDFIYNEAALMPFMEFMEREGAVVLLHFWLAVDNFEQQVEGGLPQAEIQADAMGIYKRFFHAQAGETLGVDESTRVHVEGRICAEGSIAADAFDRARHLVITALRLHFFPLFLKSDLYSQFVGDVTKSPRAKLPSQPDSPPGTPGRVGSPEPVFERDMRAAMTPWGEYTGDTAFGKGPVVDHGALTTRINDLMKITVGRIRVRKADLDLAQEVAQQLVLDVYGEMDGHGTRTAGVLMPSPRAAALPADPAPDWDARMPAVDPAFAPHPAWDVADAI